MSDAPYDVVCIGRSSIDLYSGDIGVPFPNVSSFRAYVGGCPTNIAVGTARLGLRTALLTAVGDDPVGEFVLEFLRRQQVAVDHVPCKRGRRTSAVVLGIEPPDKFPLTFYRDNCADAALTINDVAAAAVTGRVLLVTGTALTTEPGRSATLYAAEHARHHGGVVVVDLDLRLDQWRSLADYAVNVRALVRMADLVIGTREEIVAAGMTAVSSAIVDHQITSPHIDGDEQRAVHSLLRLGPQTVVVKRGADGSTMVTHKIAVDRAAFRVDVCNILGAGDAFAAGLIAARARGASWDETLRDANACGAIVVQRPGCADFMPTREELHAFLRQRGEL